MVRILVPEGEGQHAITPSRPRGFPAQNPLLSSSLHSTVYAASFTSLLALVGRSQQGLFLKTAAYFGLFNLTTNAISIHARHEVNKGVFKLDNIVPEPAKLWEKTNHWTVDDATLGGGVLGAFLALNPRALPGVYGWKRFLGAATVGMGVGYVTLASGLGGVTAQGIRDMIKRDLRIQRREYDRLKQNEEAKQTLSFVGKIALAGYTNRTLQLIRNPRELLAHRGAGGVATSHTASQTHAQHDGSPMGKMNRPIVMQLEFKNGELTGPDMEDGYRTYKKDLRQQDADDVQGWLEEVQDLKKRTKSELTYVWRHLAHMELDLHNLLEDDTNRDMIRREIQLLNNLASDMVAKDAIFGFQIADANKRLRIIEGNSSALEEIKVPYHSPDDDVPANHNAPQIISEYVRLHWSRQKEVLGQLEHGLNHFKTLSPKEGTHLAENQKQLQTAFEQLSKNLKATERLLSWCEEQARAADEEASLRQVSESLRKDNS